MLANHMQVSDFLIGYYPFWIIYLVMTFMAILVFISIIFFTSRLANNTEIVAFISGGASFHRFSRPYFIGALVIAIFSLAVNHFILPWSNVQKNKLEPYTYSDRDREKVLGSAPVAIEFKKNEFLFIQSFNKKEKAGSGFNYQKFNKDRKLEYQLRGSNVRWDSMKKNYVVIQYLEKTFFKNGTEKLGNGVEKAVKLDIEPSELVVDALLAQNKTTPELLSMIEREKRAGNTNLNYYYNDLYSRTSMPVAIVILTILALSLASEKRRGGIGLNLALGLALAFVFVFSFEALKIVSQNKVMPPLLAMWLPNIVFAPLALWLYYRRANQ